MTFTTLASGSTGNAALVSCGDTHILLDAGISAKRITAGLAELGVKPHQLSAILLTHEHSDHVRGIASFAKKYSVPVYCHKDSVYGLDAQATPYLVEQDMDLPFEIGDIQITPFRLPHDSNYNLGYRLSDGKRSVSIATDLGGMNENIIRILSGSDLIMLESNHDIDMLRQGSYPFMLKQRILGKNGHLSNEECAQSISALAKYGTKRFVLAHLSQDNNTPELAFEQTARELENACFTEGKDVFVETAMQYKSTAKIILE